MLGDMADKYILRRGDHYVVSDNPIGGGYTGPDIWPGWWVPFRLLYWALPPLLVVTAFISSGWERFRTPATVVVALFLAAVVPFMLLWSKRPKWDVRTTDYVAAVFLSVPWIGAIVSAHTGNWLIGVAGIVIGVVTVLIVGSSRRR